MKTVKFGIIGAGLMGREFASACARWCHLTEINAKPELVAVCDKNPALYPWYQDNFPTIKQVTDDYTQLLANPEVEAVYCAVPHNLHEQIYCDIIRIFRYILFRTNNIMSQIFIIIVSVSTINKNYVLRSVLFFAPFFDAFLKEFYLFGR